MSDVITEYKKWKQQGEDLRAKSIGIRANTLLRWMKEAEFQL